MKLPLLTDLTRIAIRLVAFTPKGGCPLKPEHGFTPLFAGSRVAFTPKGGCPLKPVLGGCACSLKT